MLIDENKELFEMANVSKNDTGLPYDILIDSVGRDRKIGHNKPRLKVSVGRNRIPVSISSDPKILVNRDIPKFSEVRQWIIKYMDVLLKHWNKELTDKQALNELGE